MEAAADPTSPAVARFSGARSSRYAHVHATDLHGFSRLAIDGVLGTTSLVEQMHYAIRRVSGPSLRSADGRTRGITGLVYRSIHGVTGLVGGSLNLAFGQLVPRLPQAQSTPQRDRMLAILNGVLGDHLETTGNPLALHMALRYAGRPLSTDPAGLAAQLPEPRRKIAIFLHGLCMNDHHWAPVDAEDTPVDLPRRVEEATGYLPLHLNYNSGRPIARNGEQLAHLLEELTRNWPTPIDELALIGHSMGGLVARSAGHYAQRYGHAWSERSSRLIALGSPHHGAPLERIGHKVDQALALTPFSAPFTRLGAVRSAGITDLRHGRVVDPDQALLQPPRMRLYAVAATLADHAETWKSRTVGDGLVTVDSALGRHLDPDQQPLPHRQRVVTRSGHLQLLRHPDVADQVLDWLSDD